jgi:hypothetical protein
LIFGAISALDSLFGAWCLPLPSPRFKSVRIFLARALPVFISPEKSFLGKNLYLMADITTHLLSFGMHSA